MGFEEVGGALYGPWGDVVLLGYLLDG